MFIKRSFLNAVPALGLALLLAGCGGGGGGGEAPPPTGGSGPQPGAGTPDGFISQVMAIIGNTSETAAPEDIGSINASKPEASDPVPVS